MSLRSIIENYVNDFYNNTTFDEAIRNFKPSSAMGNVADAIESSGWLTSGAKQNELNREFNSAEAALNRQFQHDEAQIEREFYEAMSNSAYQRSVADLKAAGLNPALAYSQGGAASAGVGISSGSAASANNTTGETISSFISSASSIAQAIASLKNAFTKKGGNTYNFYK